MIKEASGIEHVELIGGAKGEFTVWVGDLKVATKDHDGFPREDDAVARVLEALS